MFTFLFNFLYYLFAFIVALFVLLLGVIGVILPWSPKVRTDFVTLILEHSLAISLFGFALLVIGLGILISISLNLKKRYYYIRVKGQAIAVDESIIQHYLDSYWKQLFPGTEVSSHLVLKNNKIKVSAELPYMPELVQKELLKRIKFELPDVLFKIIGYSRELDLKVAFRSGK